MIKTRKLEIFTPFLPLLQGNIYICIEFGEIMAGNPKDIMESLIAKFRSISDLCKTFENENGALKDRLAQREQEMQALQKRYDELEKRYRNLKLSKSITEQEGSSAAETKARFARLVREIDKCISLLNE